MGYVCCVADVIECVNPYIRRVRVGLLWDCGFFRGCFGFAMFGCFGWELLAGL